MNVRIAGIVVLFVLCVVAFPKAARAQEADVEGGDVEIVSGGQAYLSYLAAPTTGGPYPGIILIHSNRGLEPGYRTITEQLAEAGFVALAVGWQTFEERPSDDVVQQLVVDSIAFLSARDDVDPARIGLTGFCAGGRYTMLLLPQVEGLAAGVAWYGFPTRGDPAPIGLVAQLDAPMLVIHGTADEASPIADIYQYATALQDAQAYFELKVYYGEPHGFMLADGELRTDDLAQNAFDEMVGFFTRKLAG